MLEGITVLSETVHKFTILDEIGIIFACICLAALLGIFACLLIENGYIGLFIGVFMFVIALIKINCTIDKTTYTIYKVTISDEVNFVEFTNKYEVLSQEGQIYKIREKETE